MILKKLSKSDELPDFYEYLDFYEKIDLKKDKPFKKCTEFMLARMMTLNRYDT